MPAEEEANGGRGRLRFDIGLLAERLVDATDWLEHGAGIRPLSIDPSAPAPAPRSSQ